MWYDWSNAEKDFSFQNFHVKLFIIIPRPGFVSILVLAKHEKCILNGEDVGMVLEPRSPWETKSGRLTLRIGSSLRMDTLKGQRSHLIGSTTFIIGLRNKNCRICIEFESLQTQKEILPKNKQLQIIFLSVIGLEDSQAISTLGRKIINLLDQKFNTAQEHDYENKVSKSVKSELPLSVLFVTNS